MGMAASQARFLGITARKTNTEYEGQQVNQQRTALANQSANLFNQLLGLDLPVPPSKSDSEYTKTVYAFTDDAGQKATIESIVNNPDTATNVEWPKIVKYTTSENKSVSYRNNLATTGTIYYRVNTDGTPSSWINVGNGSVAELFQINVNDLKAQSNIYNGLLKKPMTPAEAAKATSSLYRTKDGNYVNIDADTTFTGSVTAIGGKTALPIEKNGEKYTITTKGYGKQELTELSDAEKTVAGHKTDDMIYKFTDPTGKEYLYDLGTVNFTADLDSYDVNGADKGKANVTYTAGKYQTATGELEKLAVGGSSVSDVDRMMIEEIQKTYADTQTDAVFYRYTLANQSYYIPKSQTKGDYKTNTFELDTSKTLEPPYAYFVQNKALEIEKEYKARATYDASGRLQSIMLDNGSTDAYSISVNSVTDEDKYEDAMNQYKYDMAQYEKTVEDINAQTEAIQVQDRTLELRLKQLDTEQEALTQEMDAIKKVIDKNVETTFKTFA
ncbi:hypothetical protein J6Q66_08185 [bacterium]|nr:hypothetical protein [bacterium]